MFMVDSFEWFVEQARKSPDEFLESLRSERLTSKPNVLAQAISVAQSYIPENKLVPVLRSLLSQPDNSLRLCVLNTLSAYYDAANVEIEYLSTHDPDPVCRSVAARIRQERKVASIVASYVAVCIFMCGWAIASVAGYGYAYLFFIACLSVLRFVVTLMEVDAGGENA